MSSQGNLQNTRLTVGEAVIWNSRRIEKIELEFTKKNQNDKTLEEHVELKVQLKTLQDKYNQLSTLVSELEQRVEEDSHVSLNITEKESDDE